MQFLEGLVDQDGLQGAVGVAGEEDLRLLEGRKVELGNRRAVKGERAEEGAAPGLAEEEVKPPGAGRADGAGLGRVRQRVGRALDELAGRTVGEELPALEQQVGASRSVSSAAPEARISNTRRFRSPFRLPLKPASAEP